MDCASSELFVEGSGKYDLHFKNAGRSKSVPHLTNKQLNTLFESYAGQNPIVSIEDPFDQDDWEGWSAITAGLGKNIQIVGDDLLVNYY